MNCPECGRLVRDDAKVCVGCESWIRPTNHPGEKMIKPPEICNTCGLWKYECACQGQATPLPASAFGSQVGGDWYKSMAIQPAEFIHKNGLNYIEGAILKYICRWRKRNGVEDLKKARHYLDLLIEMEEKKP